MLEYDRCGGKEGKTKNSRFILRPYIILLHIHIVIFWFTTLSKLAYMATLDFVLRRWPVWLSAGTFFPSWECPWFSSGLPSKFRLVYHIRPWPFHTMSFPIFYSLIILRFSAIYSELMNVTSYCPVNVNIVEDLNFCQYRCENYYLTRQFQIHQNGMPSWCKDITRHNAAECPLIYATKYPTST